MVFSNLIEVTTGKPVECNREVDPEISRIARESGARFLRDSNENTPH